MDKIKASVQAQLIRITVIKCQKYGINVLSVTCDGTYSNFSSLHILRCDLNFDNLKSYININPNTPNIYLTPDVCHNIKLARKYIQGIYRWGKFDRM